MLFGSWRESGLETFPKFASPQAIDVLIKVSLLIVHGARKLIN